MYILWLQINGELHVLTKPATDSLTKVVEKIPALPATPPPTIAHPRPITIRTSNVPPLIAKAETLPELVEEEKDSEVKGGEEAEKSWNVEEG